MLKSRSRDLLFRSAAARMLCTETKTATSPTQLKRESLYRRLSALGTTNGNVALTANKWLKEGNFVQKSEIGRCIRELRKYKRFKHAIELLDWMEKKGTKLTTSDYAIRLDLLSKVEGIASAEKYFMSLPEPAKNQLTYGALLNCYCKEKMPEKAMELFEKMKELNFTSNILVYNNLMSLYMRLEQPEKVPPLIVEMKVLGISLDKYSYSVLMNCYASLNDIEGVERVLEETKSKGEACCDWTTYSNLANIYIGAGLSEKADLALKELEKRANLKDHGAFHFLITLYAGMQNLAEVKRVWESLRTRFPKTTNLSYLVMLRSLSKLDDIDSMKMYFDEWESACSSYDIRLANVMINVYLGHDMIREAISILENAINKGVKPNLYTMDLFVDFYLKTREVKLALKFIETAVSIETGSSKLRLSQEKVRVCMNFFEEGKDVNGVEEFYKLLKKVGCVDYEVYDSLLRTYIAAEKTCSLMRQRIKEDGIEIGPETEKLLEMVCSE